jgi:hypothetical protein
MAKQNDTAISPTTTHPHTHTHALPCSARFKDDLLPYLENKKVDVYWADHRLAALWANSEAAKAEFPDYTYLVRLWHCFRGGGVAHAC